MRFEKNGPGFRAPARPLNKTAVFENHSDMEKRLNVPADHVIIDRTAYNAIAAHLDGGKVIANLRKK